MAHKISLAIAISLLSVFSHAQGEVKKNRLEETTVYGQRFGASLADTGASVTVFTEDDIFNGQDSVTELLVFTPNISVFGGNNGPTVRGQNSGGPASGGAALVNGGLPRTAIQVDGRPISYNEFIYGQTGVWDVAQVEIFTGPQTTTQGANSIAGAIFVKTNDPTDKFEAKVRAFAGDDDLTQLSAVISGPIVGDQIMGRLAIDSLETDTWRETATTKGTGNPATDFADIPGTVAPGDPDTEELQTIRAKLLIRPDALPGFEALITITDNEAWAPQTTILLEDPMTGLRFEDRQNPQHQAHWTTDSQTQSIQLSYDVSDAVNIKNTTVFAETDIMRNSLVNTGGNVEQRGDELVNELLVTIKPEDAALTGSIGVYYRNVEEDVEVFDLFPGTFVTEKESNAVFGQVNYQVNEKLDVTVGARYLDYSQEQNGALFGGFIPLAFEDDESELLPRAEIKYALNENTNIGFGVTKGFNPGSQTFAFNLFGTNPSEAFDSFESESLWNYEFFARGSSLDQTLTWQANVFYTDFKDQQRTAISILGGEPVSIVRNADSAQSYGAEGSIQWNVNKTIYLTAGLGLLETELEEFPEDLSPADNRIEGNEFSKSPGVTANIGVTYQPIEALSLNASVRYNGGYYTDDLNTRDTEISSYTVVDLRANYQITKYLEVFAYANNVFDEFYLTENFGMSAYAGDPRQAGAGFTVSFK